MPDATLLRRPPVDGDTLPSAPGFICRFKPPAARLSLRLDPDHAGLVTPAFGAALPLRPLQSATGGSRAALWLGPDEWLLLTEDGEADAIAAGIRAALDGVPHSLVDVSHRQGALAVEGDLAARVLSSGCTLDLAQAAFPVGTVARILFHKAEIVLWREEPQRFHVETWRSFTDYVCGHLAAALQGTRGLSAAAWP